MAPRKIHPALRHGLYSALTVLPGEDYAAFQKLCQHLVEEYAPSGASEVGLVHNIARLVWRKKNLATYRLAHLARRHCDDVVEDRLRRLSGRSPLPKDVEARARREAQAREEAEQEVREELGPEGGLLDLEDDHEAMMGDLAVHEKLDAMIARNIKQLLLVKGLKTVAGLGPSATARNQQVVETRPGLRLAAPVTTATPPPQVAQKK
jgi:hypothetical protein